MPTPAQRAYLRQHGVTDQSSVGEVSRLLDQYRRERKRQQNRAFAQKNRRLEIRFNPDDFEHVEKAAARHEMALAAYGREQILNAAQDRSAYVLLDDSQYKTLLRKLNGATNNINRWTKWAHHAGDLREKHITQALDELAWLKAELYRIYYQPAQLTHYLKKLMTCRPETRAEIVAVLRELDEQP